MSRWEKVRAWMPGTDLSPPYLLDTKWGTLLPFHHEEWWQSKEGLWFPIPQGGTWGPRQPQVPILGDNVGLTVSTLTLNSVYRGPDDASPAGDSYCLRFVPMRNLTVSNVYVHVSAIAGTPGQHVVELRNDGNDKPGTTKHETKNFTPTAAGWVKTTGWTYALTAGTYYWLCVGNPNFTAGNTATFSVRSNFGSLSSSNLSLSASNQYSTTNGYSTAPTSQTRPAMIIAEMANGDVVGGYPFTAVANAFGSSVTTARGLGFTENLLLDDLEVLGFHWATASSVISGLKIWEGLATPNLTPVETSTKLRTTSGATPAKVGCFTNAIPFRFKKKTPYSVMVTLSSGSASAGPTRYQIGTGSDAALRKAMPGEGSVFYRTDNTTSWTDTLDEFPGLTWLLYDQVTPPNVLRTRATLQG